MGRYQPKEVKKDSISTIIGLGITPISKVFQSNSTDSKNTFIDVAVKDINIEAGEPIPGDDFTVLMHMEGPDSAFVDEGGHTVVSTGVVDDSRRKFGSTAAYLGVHGGEHIDITGSDLSVGTGDFTFDCWVRPTSYLGCIFSLSDLACYIDPSGRVQVVSDAINMGGTTVVPTTDWTHIAVTRSGLVTRLYINGTKENQQTYNSAFNDTTLAVGVYNKYGALAYTGLIDEFRMLVGSAVWTGDSFSVPTSAYVEEVPGVDTNLIVRLQDSSDGQIWNNVSHVDLTETNGVYTISGQTKPLRSLARVVLDSDDDDNGATITSVRVLEGDK